MALSPEQTIAKRQECADYLEIQIDAWLTSQWNEPSRTCFQIPSHWKHNPRYAEIIALILQRYRPKWPHVQMFSPNGYSCDFIAFVTGPDETEQASA